MGTTRARLGAALLGSLVLPACLAQPPSREERAAGITDGWPDDGDPEVVGLVADERIFCTGTLVAPAVVLTAAHCVLAFEPEAVLFGASYADEEDRIAATGWRTHPDYEPATLDADVAVVLLARAAPVEPALVLAGLTDAELEGRALRAVGFGRASPDDAGPPRKRMGTTRIESVGASTLTFRQEPSQTCMGDSGGPSFVEIDGLELLAGVHSFGDPQCTDYATDARADTLAPGLVEPYADLAPSPGRPLVGHCGAAPADARRPWVLLAFALLFRRVRSRRRTAR